MILTKTPYRLSFFGGGTDYNPWFEKNGGLVVGSTINKYNYISLRSLPPFFDHKTRVVYSNSERVNSIEEIEHPAVKGCLQYLNNHEGLEIHHDGDLPARSGIGSSSSFTVGLLKALHAYNGNMISKYDLAKEAIHVEQNVVGENVGCQDQILASYGGLQIIKFGPGNNFTVEPLILTNEYIRYMEDHFLLGFSGIHRFADKSAGEQIRKINDGDLDQKMRDIMSIAEDGLGLLSRAGEMKEVGALFDKTWQIKRRLTDGISNSSIDDAYNIAMKNGAYGGRLLGAGAGGFMVFIAPPEKHKQIKEALRNNIKVWVPFKFDKGGSQVVLYDEHKSMEMR